MCQVRMGCSSFPLPCVLLLPLHLSFLFSHFSQGRFNESLRLLQEANGEENELAFAPGQLEGGGGVCSKEKAERAEVTGTGEQGRVGLRLDKSSLPPRAPARWRTVLSEVRLTRVASEEDCEWVISTAEKHALETGAPGLPSSSRLAQLPPSSPWSLSFPSLPGRHCPLLIATRYLVSSQ